MFVALLALSGLLDENSGLSSSCSPAVRLIPGLGVTEVLTVGALAGISTLPGPSCLFLLLLVLLLLLPLAGLLLPFAVEDIAGHLVEQRVCLEVQYDIAGGASGVSVGQRPVEVQEESE